MLLLLLLLLLLQLCGSNTCAAVAVESWLGLRFTIVVLITVLRRLGVVGRAAMRGLGVVAAVVAVAAGVAAVNVALSLHSTSVAAPTNSWDVAAGSPHSPVAVAVVAVAVSVSVAVVIVILFCDDFGESIFELLLLFVWGSAVSGNLQ